MSACQNETPRQQDKRGHSLSESSTSDGFVIYVRPRAILLIGIASIANVDIVESIFFVQLEPAFGFCRLLLLLIFSFNIVSTVSIWCCCDSP